ncbi:IMP dehydrogenase [Candidatus Uhrbacteria bacterium]|nr:IMP dehydrogenase [Candidatus Uhrbacteria bacterium]
MKILSTALTFDDILLVPQESEVRPSTVEVRTTLTRQVALEIPILTAAMDTVTDARMAAAISQEGGLGIIHRNCTIEQQVSMVKSAKKLGAKKVGAAVGPHDHDRAIALDRTGVTVIAVDCASAHKPSIAKNARAIKKAVKAELIVGNIATAAAARSLLGIADALKVGVGPGSICTTRIVAGIGVPQLSAIMDVAPVAKKRGIPVIADGGIRYSGDIAKALAAGASAVMLGSLVAGTDQAPGNVVTIKGKKYKRFRGMGSLGAMSSLSADRYQQQDARKYVPEGVEAIVEYKGDLHEVVFQLIGGLRAGMGYVGAKTIAELQHKAVAIRITEAGKRESHPHSILIEKQAPNYHA